LGRCKKVQSVHSGEKINMAAHVFQHISSNIPSTKLSVNHWKEVQHLHLADEDFNTPKNIDILLEPLGLKYHVTFKIYVEIIEVLNNFLHREI